MRILFLLLLSLSAWAEGQRDLNPLRKELEAAMTRALSHLSIPVKEGDKLLALPLADEIAKLLPPGAKIYFAGDLTRDVLARIHDSTNSKKDLKGYAASGRAIPAGELAAVETELRVIVPSDTSPEALKELNALADKALAALRGSAALGLKNSAYFRYLRIETVDAAKKRIAKSGGSSFSRVGFALSHSGSQWQGALEELVPEKGIDFISLHLRGGYRYSATPLLFPQSPTANYRLDTENSFAAVKAQVLSKWFKLDPKDIPAWHSDFERAVESSKTYAFEEGYNIRQRALESLTSNMNDHGISNEELRSAANPFHELYEYGKSQSQQNFPEFLARAKPEYKSFPEELLLSRESFVKNYTNDSYLFHGSSGQGAIGILRTGPFVSSEEHGNAVFGAGFYTTGRAEVALEYGDVLIPFKLSDRPLKILKLDKIFYESSFYKAFRASHKAGLKSDALIKALTEEYGIDIVINGYPGHDLKVVRV